MEKDFKNFDFYLKLNQTLYLLHFQKKLDLSEI